MNEIMPFILKTGTFGLITGFCIGYAFKKISKLIALVIGIFLIGFQLLAYNSFITIDWLALEQFSETFVHSNNLNFDTIKEVFLTNLPFASTALAGFLVGLKKG